MTSARERGPVAPVGVGATAVGNRRTAPPGARDRARAGARETARAGERGSVAAEFAVVLPAVVLVLLLTAGALGASARQVRLQDAAADAARLVAREEPAARAQAAVATAVSGGAASIAYRGDVVCVTATAPSGVPLVPARLEASSCALAGGW